MRRKMLVAALVGALALFGVAACSSSGGGGGVSEGSDASGVTEETQATDQGEGTEGEAPEGDAAEGDPEVDAPVVEDDFPPDSEEAGTEFVHQRQVEDAEAAGRLVITGTLQILDGVELCQLQEAPQEMIDSIANTDSRYALVVFDEPQMLCVMHSGDFGEPYEGEATMVAVAIDESNDWGHEGDMSIWEPYDGQVVTVSIDPNETLFPSDVRLPLGQPHTSSAELLFAE